MGSDEYFAARSGLGILRHRLGAEAKLNAVEYREVRKFGDVNVSFYPAGHVLGSAQILIEGGGHRLVISGDYKRDADPSCEAFEVVPCDTFVTEATFALPIYRWQPGRVVAQEILRWWEQNKKRKKTSVLYGYSLGKTQRLLAELALITDQPVYVHGAVEPLTEIYRQAGIRMLPTIRLAETKRGESMAGELVLAPPSAHRTPWIKRFDDFESAFASGWMRVRGARRRNNYDRGFVLSDHVDWPGLLRTLDETGAKKILVTHGSSETIVRYLREQGRDAEALTTFFGKEDEGE